MPKVLPRILLAIILGLFISANASAATYYVAANGSDSNSGTSNTAPWLHAPGMPSCTGTCASTNPQPGDRFIFRGGDTWHFHSGAPAIGGTWDWSWSGAGANCQLNASAGTIAKTSCIYIGTDHTWYAGTSYARPLLSQDAPISNSRPSSCAFDATNFQGFNGLNQNYLILDDFEMSGVCWQGNTMGGWVNVNGTQVEVSNMYFHGWMYGANSSSDDYWAITGGMSKANYILCDHNVFDNSDGTFGNQGQTNGAQGNASGASITNSCKEIAFNSFRQVSNGCICNPNSVHDNTFTQLYQAIPGSQHGNVVEWNSSNSATGCTIAVYNNLIYNVHQGETFDIEQTSCTGGYQNAYIFNNVDWQIGNSGNCWIQDNDSTNEGTYYFNNTFEAPCTIRAVNSYPSTTNVTFENNHLIGYQSATCTGTCSSALSNVYSTINNAIDNGNHVFQSEATANSQGYTPSNNYAPTAQGNATVGTGANLASFCSEIGLSAAATACSSATSIGVLEVSGEGGLVVQYPAIALNARAASGAWDVGAYEYSASGAVAPPTGLAAIVR